MAGSLIKIDELDVTVATTSMTITGIDSTYDVYQLIVTRLTHSTSSFGRDVYMRVTESGTANSTANYDIAYKDLNAGGAFGNTSATNQTYWKVRNFAGTSGDEYNFNFYLFNFNNSSEYSFMTMDNVGMISTPSFYGGQGGGVFTSTSNCDGINLTFGGDSWTAKLVLYGLKK